MIRLTIIFLTAFTNPPTNLEQRAVDYFFSTIFKQEYPDYKVIEFDFKTDTSHYYGIVHQCKNWDKETKWQIMSAKPRESVEIKVERADLKIKRRKTNSDRLKVYVYSNISVGDNYFVLIGTYRKLRFAEYYFIKLDNLGKIIETCKTGEII